jgi:hypothetical protein
MDVKEEDGHLREAEGERVEEDTVPSCLNFCQSQRHYHSNRRELTLPQAMADSVSLGSRSQT